MLSCSYVFTFFFEFLCFYVCICFRLEKWNRCGIGVSSKWDRSGFEVIAMRPKWIWNEIDVESNWGRSETKMNSKWDRSEIEVESMWNIISNWNRCETDVRSKWERSETEVSSKWIRSETPPPPHNLPYQSQAGFIGTRPRACGVVGGFGGWGRVRKGLGG